MSKGCRVCTSRHIDGGTGPVCEVLLEAIGISESGGKPRSGQMEGDVGQFFLLLDELNSGLPVSNESDECKSTSNPKKMIDLSCPVTRFLLLTASNCPFDIILEIFQKQVIRTQPDDLEAFKIIILAIVVAKHNHLSNLQSRLCCFANEYLTDHRGEAVSNDLLEEIMRTTTVFLKKINIIGHEVFICIRDVSCDSDIQFDMTNVIECEGVPFHWIMNLPDPISQNEVDEVENEHFQQRRSITGHVKTTRLVVKSATPTQLQSKLNDIPAKTYGPDLEKDVCEYLCNYIASNNIVRIHAAEIKLGRTVIVMENCDSNLEDYLKEKSLDVVVAANFIVQLALCLKQMHSKGIFHLDLKLTNILISISSGSAIPLLKLCDFGNSALKSEGVLRESSRPCTAKEDLWEELEVDPHTKMPSQNVTKRVSCAGRKDWEDFVKVVDQILQKVPQNQESKQMDSEDLSFKNILLPLRSGIEKNEILSFSKVLDHMRQDEKLWKSFDNLKNFHPFLGW
eukprot:TRINITY_DN14500_c0_g2_i1.p1 TRINITY_DN14500_c0_g2~~TRINITY_DN14500_c0_g2_i1.p1  ORF type:complete len:510 (-),score=101.27 TRINITY_DN14500_c0_g2_i1:106-1635(-)